MTNSTIITTTEAAMEANEKSYYTKELNFEVEKQPLMVGDYKVPNQMAVVNTGCKNDGGIEIGGDGGMIYPNHTGILGIVGKSYNLFNNERFTELTDKIGRTLELDFDHYGVHNNGKNILAAFKKTDKKFEINGFEFSNHVIVSDNRGGNASLTIGSAGNLYRCKNMFSSTNKLVKIRHCSTLDEQLEEFLNGLEKLAKYQDQKIERLEKLDTIKCNKDDVLRMMNNVYFKNLDAGQIKGLASAAFQSDDTEFSTRGKNIMKGFLTSWDIESKSLGNNAFALWNSLTHYYTHNRKKGQIDLAFSDFGKKEELVLQFAEAIA